MDEFELSLIKKAKGGDNEAMEKLIERHTPLMHQLVQKYSMFGSNYEDLLQEVRTRFVEAVRLFDPDKAKLVTFAHIIINYTLARQAKHESRIKRGGSNTTITLDSQGFLALEETMNAPPVTFNQFHHIELLATCDKSLNRVEAEVLEASAEGYTYKEIAEQKSRTYTRITSIKKSIKKKLGKAISSEEDS